MLRDAKKAEAARQLENNTCWDDLMGIHNDCVALMMMHVSIGGLANNAPLVRAVRDKATLLTNLRLYQTDLQQLNRELSEIASKHADKKGGSQDPDEVMFSIEIHEMYIYWQQRHDAVLKPTALYIAEQFDEAEAHLAQMIALQQQAQAQDPTQITDAAEKPSEVNQVVINVQREVGSMLEDVRASGEERTLVHVQLDENDPNPKATLAAVVNELQSAPAQ
jgi:hypothetical protein